MVMVNFTLIKLTIDLYLVVCICTLGHMHRTPLVLDTTISTGLSLTPSRLKEMKTGHGMGCLCCLCNVG